MHVLLRHPVFNNRLYTLIYHLTPRFRSMRNMDKFWSLRSTPPMNLLYSSTTDGFITASPARWPCTTPLSWKVDTVVTFTSFQAVTEMSPQCILTMVPRGTLRSSRALMAAGVFCRLLFRVPTTSVARDFRNRDNSVGCRNCPCIGRGLSLCNLP